MRKKQIPSISWEEAPDIIMPEDLAKILGIGIQSARKMFDKKDFPKISKEDIGNQGKADKEAVRLYIQGFKIKENLKTSMEYMILLELKKISEQMNRSERL